MKKKQHRGVPLGYLLAGGLHGNLAFNRAILDAPTKTLHAEGQRILTQNIATEPRERCPVTEHSGRDLSRRCWRLTHEADVPHSFGAWIIMAGAPLDAEIAAVRAQLDPGTMSDRDVLAYVSSFDDSIDGPIRFPGSIAESNQGPDPRYLPWMSRCQALAATIAADPHDPSCCSGPCAYCDEQERLERERLKARVKSTTVELLTLSNASHRLYIRVGARFVQVQAIVQFDAQANRLMTQHANLGLLDEYSDANGVKFLFLTDVTDKGVKAI